MYVPYMLNIDVYIICHKYVGQVYINYIMNKNTAPNFIILYLSRKTVICIGIEKLAAFRNRYLVRMFHRHVQWLNAVYKESSKKHFLLFFAE